MMIEVNYVHFHNLNRNVLDLGKQVRELSDENARLKAEVERLKEGNECLDQMHEKEMARSAFLCEEVNRTTAWGRGLESDLSWARAELLMVKAEVERLTAFTTRTIIPNEELQAQVEELQNRCDFLEGRQS
jgi:cell division protein FtsL